MPTQAIAFGSTFRVIHRAGRKESTHIIYPSDVIHRYLYNYVGDLGRSLCRASVVHRHIRNLWSGSPIQTIARAQLTNLVTLFFAHRKAT